MKILNVVLIGAAGLVLTACSSSGDTKQAVAEDGIYCTVEVDAGMQYVYRYSDAEKYADDNGNLPSCHNLHAAKHNPGVDSVQHNAYRMNLRIKKLEQKVEELKRQQKEQE